MATRAPAISTAQLHEHLGRDMIALMRPILAVESGGTTGQSRAITYDDERALGKALAGLIRASHKATVPGRQSNKQIATGQALAQQAFARALRRKAKALS